MAPAHLDPRIPKTLAKRTTRLLKRMLGLTKGLQYDATTRKRLRRRCDEIESSWTHLAATAKTLLANGKRYGVTFYAWRASVKKSAEFKRYDGVRSYWRQQDPAYKRWKARYDAERTDLIQRGLWEQTKAMRSAERLYWDLVEAITLNAPQEAIDVTRGRFVDALFTAKRVGVHCERCDRHPCVHEVRYRRDAVWTWLSRVWRNGMTCRESEEGLGCYDPREAAKKARTEAAKKRSAAPVYSPPMTPEEQERRRAQRERLRSMEASYEAESHVDIPTKVVNGEPLIRLPAGIWEPLRHVSAAKLAKVRAHYSREAVAHASEDIEDGPPVVGVGRFINGKPMKWTGTEWIPDTPLPEYRPIFGGKNSGEVA